MLNKTITTGQYTKLLKSLVEDRNERILNQVNKIAEQQNVSKEDASVIASTILLAIQPLEELTELLGNTVEYNERQQEVFLLSIDDELKRKLKELYICLMNYQDDFMEVE